MIREEAMQLFDQQEPGTFMTVIRSDAAHTWVAEAGIFLKIGEMWHNILFRGESEGYGSAAMSTILVNEDWHTWSFS